MSKDKVDKHFISDDDRFLNDFDKQHPEKSTSQLEEISKHERIFKLRDDATASDETADVFLA